MSSVLFLETILLSSIIISFFALLSLVLNIILHSPIQNKSLIYLRFQYRGVDTIKTTRLLLSISTLNVEGNPAVSRIQPTDPMCVFSQIFLEKKWIFFRKSFIKLLICHFVKLEHSIPHPANLNLGLAEINCLTSHNHRNLYF